MLLDNIFTYLMALRKTVDQQAEDEGLWFNATTATEAYLQQELRRLHAIIETPFKLSSDVISLDKKR